MDFLSSFSANCKEFFLTQLEFLDIFCRLIDATDTSFAPPPIVGQSKSPIAAEHFS